MSIEIKEVDYTYSQGTPFAHKALDNLSLTIPEGKITAIIGQTGSGKSTLVQHLNGLLLPEKGEIDIAGYRLLPATKPKNIKDLRKKVGLVFQFPESQLFEETVLKDIAFGPKNFGIEEEKASELAQEILPKVGLSQEILEKSPFELSGGQKRRVAIAGTLVLDPSILVLDEPTAGLDPQGAKEMLDTFKRLNTQEGKTILLVSHDMEQVLDYADEVIVMDKGKAIWQGEVKDFFARPEMLEELNVEAPDVIKIKEELKNAGFDFSRESLDLDSVAEEIGAALC